MAQTSDGWFWLGSSTGLYRFDGVHFERVEINGLDPRRSRAISMLLALESGELWIGYVYGGASRLKNGRFTHFSEAEGMGHGTVVDFEQGMNGEVWAASTDAIARFDGTRWQRVGTESGYPDRYAQAVFRDQHGRLWVAGAQEIFFLERDGSTFHHTGLRFAQPPGFLQSPDGRTWYADGTGIHALPDQVGTSPRGSWSNSRRSYNSLIDDNGEIWFSTRVVAHWSAPPEDMQNLFLRNRPKADEFSTRDGLTDSVVKTIFQDREGNIWIATMGGLDQFRRPNVVRLPPMADKGALALAAGEGGSLWIGTGWGTMDQPTDGLWRYDGRLQRITRPSFGHISAIDRDDGGVVWVAGPRGMWRTDRDRRFHKLPDLPEGARGEDVHAFTVDSGGAPWAAIMRSSLFRLHDGVWERNGHIPELPDQRPQTQARDRIGRLWFGYRDGTVAVVEAGRARLFGPKNGLDIGTIFAINVGQYSVVASEGQLAILVDGRFHPLSAIDPSVFEGVTGIVEPGNGDLWLNGFRGAVRIAAADLENALRREVYRVPCELFDAGDGFPGFAQRHRPIPTLIKGTDGRLWFAGTRGLAWIDPAHITRNAAPPPLFIRSLSAGDRAYPTKGQSLLPKGTTSLQVDYTALSFTRPDRIRFRYRLDGFDAAWIEAGTRRQAFYTNLRPGSYHFRVTAASENGAWNGAPASVDILIPPTFMQTRIFIALCLAAGLGLLWCVYLLRARQLMARERGRLEARHSERERIARELHDTLLQSVQGLTLRFHTAAMQVPKGSPAHKLIERALQTADRVFAEGRDRVQELRTYEASMDLPKAVAEFGADLAKGESIAFRLKVSGTPRRLCDDVQTEVFAIAREAITNAFRHAGATSVETEIIYGPSQFSADVRDDGRGMEVELLRAGGRPGHWGLAGMRERAKTIRGALNIRSQPGVGTEVELRVSAAIAYMRERNILRWRRSRGNVGS